MTIDVAAFRDSDAALSRSLLANVITSVSGGIYPPRGARLSRLWERVTRGDLDRTATLGGCVIRPGRAARAGQIDIAREKRRDCACACGHRAGDVLGWPVPGPGRRPWDARSVHRCAGPGGGPAPRRGRASRLCPPCAGCPGGPARALSERRIGRPTVLFRHRTGPRDLPDPLCPPKTAGGCGIW